MNKKITFILAVITIIVLFLIVKFVILGEKTLVNPITKEATGLQENTPSSEPQTSAYNPPKEIKYDESTDLRKELESINPQVLDSDLE